jgi:hypothetical protein
MHSENAAAVGIAVLARVRTLAPKRSGGTPNMKRKWLVGAAVAAGLILVSLKACSFSGGPVSGVVVDQTTKKPIADAIVVARWFGDWTKIFGRNGPHRCEWTLRDSRLVPGPVAAGPAIHLRWDGRERLQASVHGAVHQRVAIDCEQDFDEAVQWFHAGVFRLSLVQQAVVLRPAGIERQEPVSALYRAHRRSTDKGSDKRAAGNCVIPADDGRRQSCRP